MDIEPFTTELIKLMDKHGITFAYTVLTYLDNDGVQSFRMLATPLAASHPIIGKLVIATADTMNEQNGFRGVYSTRPNSKT